MGADSIFDLPVLGQSVCRAAQLEHCSVTTQEGVTSHLRCRTLGEIRACLGTGWFWRATEGRVRP